MSSALSQRLLPGILLLLAQALAEASGNTTPAPEFRLERWQNGEPVSLRQFEGTILVLDFFAHWCAPCRVSSPILEREIQDHYAKRNGNPNGIPVQVVSVNIENDSTPRTERFIRQTGIHFVVNDPEGATLKQYGGMGIPFIVVIDGSGGMAGTPRFDIVYRNAGFEGAETLRRVIDSIGAGPDTATAVIPETYRTHQVDMIGEVIWSSDIQISEASVAYGQSINRWDWQLTGTMKTFDEEYEPFRPFDPIGRAVDLEERTYGAQADIRYQLRDPVQLLFNGGFYDGFDGYRSLWLDNYYRQQFSFIPGYKDADPQGYNTSGGARWEYLPATGILESRIFYSRDEVAPGYEIRTDPVTGGFAGLERGREKLDTVTASISTENVLTRRIRTRLQGQVTDTTDREERYSVEGAVNIALGERWVWRSSAGFTSDPPT